MRGARGPYQQSPAKVRVVESLFLPFSYGVGAMPNPIPSHVRTRLLTMFALVFAGEMIFSLPYHLTRYFRPTVLEVFGFSNADLGDIFAPYGITAMLTYFPGGIVADRFSARKLMSFSLLATAAGGLYFMTLPGIFGLSILYAIWGVTSILLFWCALIRATRIWGGQLEQGRGFGLLDGGRGLIAALFASAGVALLRFGLGGDPSLADATERAAALQAVILYYTIGTIVAAMAVWWCIPDSTPVRDERRPQTWPFLRRVFGIRVVWLQAVIVVCAYSGYKGLDNYSLYAYDVLGMNEADAAGFSATATYIRPLAAIAAGLMGDRFGVARMVSAVFALLVGSWAMLAILEVSPLLHVIVYGNLVISIFGIFALRGLYFALLEQTGVPHSLTGAAVGLISLVGYTPDIFFAPIAGRLLDAAPGIGGHQHCFLLLAGIASVGLVVATTLNRSVGRKTDCGRVAAA